MVDDSSHVGKVHLAVDVGIAGLGCNNYLISNAGGRVVGRLRSTDGDSCLAGADDSQLAVGIHCSHFFVASSVGGLTVVVANRQDRSNQLITEDSANAFSRESASVFPSHIH